MDIVRLISTADPNPVIADILFNFGQLVNSFMGFVATLGDLAYKMIMETGQLGRALRDLVTSVCVFLRDVFVDVVQPMICWIREAAMTVLDATNTVLSAIQNFFHTPDLTSGIQNAKNNLANALQCPMANPFTCTGIFPPDPDAPSSLPMPTRYVLLGLLTNLVSTLRMVSTLPNKSGECLIERNTHQQSIHQFFQ